MNRLHRPRSIGKRAGRSGRRLGRAGRGRADGGDQRRRWRRGSGRRAGVVRGRGFRRGRAILIRRAGVRGRGHVHRRRGAGVPVGDRRSGQLPGVRLAALPGGSGDLRAGAAGRPDGPALASAVSVLRVVEPPDDAGGEAGAAGLRAGGHQRGVVVAGLDQDRGHAGDRVGRFGDRVDRDQRRDEPRRHNRRGDGRGDRHGRRHQHRWRAADRPGRRRGPRSPAGRGPSRPGRRRSSSTG